MGEGANGRMGEWANIQSRSFLFLISDSVRAFRVAGGRSVATTAGQERKRSPLPEPINQQHEQHE